MVYDLKILMIDDNPDDVYLLQKILLQGGLTVEMDVAHSALQLQQYLDSGRAQEWQLIILDYLLPDIDPALIIPTLQNLTNDTPVIIVSGQVEMDAAVALIKLGARDFIRKDDLARLVPCIERELAAAALRRERKQTLLDLRKARDVAEQASAAKTDFLLMLNHELRTPLHGMMGMLALLEGNMDGMNDKQREYTRLSRMTADGMHGLISDMLDLSKFEAGKAVLHKENFNLQACLRSAMSQFVIIAREKGLGFSLDLQHVPKCIYTDKIHLHQMMVNLIGNAIKFTDQGSVTVIASVVPYNTHSDTHSSTDSRTDNDTDNGREMLQLEVKDTGIGISTKNQASIFEPFMQVHHKDELRPRGTGLGVTLVQRFSALLGGRVEVNSELAVGSCFSVILPLQRVGDEELNRCLTMNDWSLLDDHGTTAGSTAESTALSGKQDLCILVADDDPISQLLLVDSFARIGLSVDCADHGLEAWDKLQQKTYDVLLTDLRMPQLDGIDLTKRVRAFEKDATGDQIPVAKSPPHLMIIGISADAQADVRQQTSQAGMDGFMRKPVNVSKVIDILQQYK